jgi:hypothetical protein
VIRAVFLLIFVGLVVVVCQGQAVDKDDEWLKEPPGQLEFFGPDATKISKYDIFEVSHSKFDMAQQRDLVKVSFTKLGDGAAISYSGANYKCPEKKNPYVVRAVYGYGGTGGFSLSWIGRKLLVHHGSLGPTVPKPKKTALVVNLDFEPEEVYVSYSVAR